MEQAYLEQCLAEIGQSFDEGRNEIKQLLVLRKNFADRLAALRSKYDGATQVRVAAKGAAEKLEAASCGVQMGDTFTPAELKEMRDTNLIQ
jgi:hypothetical protein